MSTPLPKCFKCKSSDGTLSSRDGPSRAYCKLCFIRFATDLFRTAFHTKCCVPSNTPLVVAVSGGRSSMVCLNLVAELRKYNLDKDPRAQVVFDVVIVHLDEGDETKRLVAAEVEKLGLKLVTVPNLCSSSSLTKYTSLVDASDEHELIQMQTLAQIVDIAKGLNSRHVVVGNHATSCAVEALDALLHGRGRTVVSRAAHTSVLEGGVSIHRPLHDVLGTEIALLAHFKSIPFVVSPRTIITQAPSIHSLTTNFVTNVQGGFKSTVFNVLQTITKMEQAGQAEKEKVSGKEVCRVCLAGKGAPLCPACDRLAFRVGKMKRDRADEEGCEFLIRRQTPEELRNSVLHEYLL